MTAHKVVLTLSLLTLTIVTGCSRDLDLFSVQVVASQSRPAEAIGLTERPAMPADEEGFALRSNDSTPSYRLDRPIAASGEGDVWYFTVVGADKAFTVLLSDPDEQTVAVHSFAPFLGSSDAHDVRLGVSVPPYSQVQAFHVQLDHHETGSAPESAADTGQSADLHPGFRLVAVEVHEASTGPTGVQHQNGVLTIGPNATVTAWPDPGQGNRTWSLTLGAANTDRPNATPAILGYAFEPSEAGDPGVTGTPEPPRVRIRAGENEYLLALRPGPNQVPLYGVGPGELSLEVFSEVEGFAPMVVSRRTYAATPDDPLPADLGTIYSRSPASWRDDRYELYRWSLFPSVIVMDTLDYDVQSSFFKRLAFFVEKEGFRGTLLPDSELRGRHGYNAHNYNGEGLAAFYNAAKTVPGLLNEDELLLRDILIGVGIIRERASGYEPGVGGILAVSQESWSIAGLRRLLLTHEAYHGVYYAVPEFVSRIDQLWTALSPDEQRFWLLLLDGLQYDVTDPYLVQNEFHAYLLQQPLREVPWYFESRSADRLRRWKPSEAAWVSAFVTENSGSFYEQASAAGRHLFETTGLIGGDVFCLTRIAP